MVLGCKLVCQACESAVSWIREPKAQSLYS